MVPECWQASAERNPFVFVLFCFVVFVVSLILPDFAQLKAELSFDDQHMRTGSALHKYFQVCIAQATPSNTKYRRNNKFRKPL